MTSTSAATTLSSELAYLVERCGNRCRRDHDAVERPGIVEELKLLCVTRDRLNNPGYRRIGIRGRYRIVFIRFARTALPVRVSLDVEPIIFLARQRKHGLMKGSLNGSQGLLTRPLLFGALLVFDQFLDVSLHWLKRRNESGVAFILNDSTARTGGQVEEWSID